MPFNPSLPAANSPVSSAELRGQFNGLKAIIDAIPPGATVAQLNDAVNALSQDISALDASLATEIAATARNPALVDTMDLVVSDPPLRDEVQQIAAKLDDLILALRR